MENYEENILFGCIFYFLDGGFPLLWLVYQSLHIKLQTTSAKFMTFLVGILPKMMINSKAKALTLQHGVGEM